MAVALPDSLFDEITDFLASGPTPQQIVDFRPSAKLDERLHYLLDRNTAGSLMGEEKAELDEFLRMSHFLNMLVLKARMKLNIKK